MKKLDRLDPKALSSNPRASLDAWLQYEPIVLAAFRQHPRAFTYRPVNRAATTVASRLRDAIRGKLAFDYPSELSTPDLLRWYSEIVVKNDQTSVYVGPLEEVRTAILGTTSSSGPALSFPSLDFEEVSAFCLLLSRGRLVGPVTITQPPDLSLLPDRPNVEKVQREDGSLVLL